MLTSINRRLRTEDGLSLVEMLMAFFVITIALFALLGTLVTSARSVQDQKARSTATRVAADAVEFLRTIDYDAAPLDVTWSDNNKTEHPPPVTLNNLQFDIEHLVQLVRADDGAVVTAETTDTTVKRVTTTVTWMSGTVERSATYTSTIAPPPPLIGGGSSTGPVAMVKQTTMLPDPVNVGEDHTGDGDPDWYPEDHVEATVVLEHFDPVPTVVTLRWADDNGSKVVNLSTVDEGITWVGPLLNTNLVKDLGSAASGTIEFTAEATNGSQTANDKYTLTFINAALEDPPAFQSTSISQSTITIQNDKNCSGAKKCVNTQELTFTANVTHLDPSLDSVRLKYQLADGTFEEVALVAPTAPGQYDGTWTLVIPAQTVKFKTGSTQPFTFTARKVSDESGAFATTTVNQNVQKATT